MFAAAMLYSVPRLEMSIYSTCKRISQKLLRNVQKFLDLIYMELGTSRMRELRINMEEIVLQGDDGEQDVRIVNSYPSKVFAAAAKCSSVMPCFLHMSALACVRSNRSCSICSEASLSAASALPSNCRLDLRLAAISRTTLSNEAWGSPLRSRFVGLELLRAICALSPRAPHLYPITPVF